VFNGCNVVERIVPLEEFAHTNGVRLLWVVVVWMTAQELPITVVPTDKKNWPLRSEYVTAVVDAKSGVIKRTGCDVHMGSVSTAAAVAVSG
jgi:hypothetical protein